ncbi:hypothetical protein [Elizabethkingia anophelis]|uniref:hypothetical protein n=1 Tax=Elizabethkingia anophelis TaxID=1117645 RepID=UPI0029359AEA|nr:hypothetical protein [Elizabethkingia anophelis]
MKLNEELKKKEKVKEITKWTYLAPQIFVEEIEMEQGIASGSATVTPVTVNGNTDNVSTDWGGTDTTTIDTPF